MGEKITADTISQTFNLASIKDDVKEGFGFMVALPFRSGGQEAYQEWAADDARKKDSALTEISTFIKIPAEAVLFKTEAMAQDFCDSQRGNTQLEGRLNVVSVSYNEKTDLVLASPLNWKQDKFAAIEKLMRK